MSEAQESDWCYHCDKHVAVRTLEHVVLCCECNKGFIRSIQAIPEPPPPLPQDSIRFEELLNELRRQREIHILRMIDRLAGYDVAFLPNILQVDNGGGRRRGAPPAAKSAVEALETFEIGSTCVEEGERMSLVCAVCKDAMVTGEIGKKLPCGHCYHDSCILPWLETRNSCPVCRFQLRTDDAEYERKRAREEPPLTVVATASSSSMIGREENNDQHVVETRRRSTRKRKPNRRFLD
ncbi:unnamed protein product [Brassica oleracea var. botrytis]|uniref:RING-type E3 ubiquitin transferase n=2 Tax=Brassica oleracea TaxID=3712 RepID=A0A0D3ADJ7_BRAOL|nr:PREDICTED: E3 ubiquitin-protein ligase CIP8-like [Brassica oleracea var. oleracea]VDD52524.1 unnamed protein product [Brassica oleracea]